ncbi:hypothetical protein E3N88_28099 [Mikania micrantha]|uniref:ARID domain-containing protein n=1 Tax=Mikania micrantha TaxID=192012 RepID=A0A5N6MYP9_9ASTR|nr:hypothetical protein E3N88_28099 [Mikania micrantha]
MHVFCILSVYLISHTHVKTKPSQPFISNIASEPNEPGTCGGPNRAKQLPRSNSVVIEESRKVEVPIVFGSFGDSGEDSGGDRDFSRENQLNMFDRDDQGKEHGDDRENHGESGLENLCKSVTDLKIGTTSRSIGNKGVMAARRKEKVTQDFSVKWYDVNKLSETEIMWNHFEQMEKIKRMKDDGKCKEPIEGPTTKDVKSIEDMVIFLDLLTALNENLLQEEFVKIKFNKMVKWFNKDVIKKGDFWVPIMEEGEVDLYHLYMSVQLNGGKDKMMHWYYTNLKKRQEEPCLFTFEEGQSSTNEAISKECSKRTKREEDGHLPYKKRRVSAIRSWPPGCGPATIKK